MKFRESFVTHFVLGYHNFKWSPFCTTSSVTCCFHGECTHTEQPFRIQSPIQRERTTSDFKFEFSTGRYDFVLALRATFRKFHQVIPICDRSLPCVTKGEVHVVSVRSSIFFGNVRSTTFRLVVFFCPLIPPCNERPICHERPLN